MSNIQRGHTQSCFEVTVFSDSHNYDEEEHQGEEMIITSSDKGHNIIYKDLTFDSQIKTS